MAIENQSFSQNSPDNRSDFRVGAGGQVGISFFYPKDMNEYLQDFWDNLLAVYDPFDYSGAPDLPPVSFGWDYQLKVLVRVINAIQIEAWNENFSGTGMGFKSDFHYWDSYGNTETHKAKYVFIPTYKTYGMNLLFTPGAIDNFAFFTFGAGIGKYKCSLNIKSDLMDEINGSVTSYKNSENYNGEKWCFNFIIGTTYVPVKFIELESFITGRLARFPEIKDSMGTIFMNPYRNYKHVSLDFSGIDLRIGIKFILF